MILVSQRLFLSDPSGKFRSVNYASEFVPTHGKETGLVPISNGFRAHYTFSFQENVNSQVLECKPAGQVAPGGQGQAPMRITGVETKAHRS